MQKYFITGTFLRFLQSYCAVVTKKYWAPEKEEISTLTIFNLLSFCYYGILGGHILNISKTIFTKLIFHLRLRDQLPDDLFL